MTNASAAIMSNYGRPSQTASTVCQLPRSLTRRSSAVTAVWVPICRAWSKFVVWCVPQMCPTLGCSAICCGVIRTRMFRAGVRMIVVLVSLLALMLYRNSWIDTSWTWFVVHIRYVYWSHFTLINNSDLTWSQVVEDGYEFFARRQLVTLFSAPNYCGEFDNAGGMMTVDDTLMCSFQVSSQFTGHKYLNFIRCHI